MKPLLQRLLPAGLRLQVAGILLLGLALSQAMAAILYLLMLPQWQRELRPELAVAKVAMVARLLEGTAPAGRAAQAQLWNESNFQVRYEDEARQGGPVRALPRPCPDNDLALRARLSLALSRPPDSIQACAPATALPPDGDDTVIQLLLQGGGLLEVRTPVGTQLRFGLLEQAAIAAFMLFAAGGLWALLTWTVDRPLNRFARAAERVGIDVDAPALPEQGPAQLRRAIRAFNEMQERLQRMLRDRTLMLGAISHDLGTPLTRLRLRVETGRMADSPRKMLEDIETMQALLASAQSFVRGVDDAEPRAVVDLDSLLQTVCDLVSDLGGEVSYGAPARSLYHCRPQAMLRALTNVVTNAVKYGSRAGVSLEKLPGRGYLVEVQDDGPGITATDKQRVFEPFYRTTAARESDQPGMGLGLSIARTVILAHGGTIELLDRLPRGLNVRIFLPESETTAPLAGPGAGSGAVPGMDAGAAPDPGTSL